MSIPRGALMSGSSDINTMNSVYAKTSPGNYTNRGAAKLG